VRAEDSPESAPSCIKKLPDEFDGEIEKKGVSLSGTGSYL